MEKEIFKNVKVGDRVWDMRFGWGTIIFDNQTREVPLYVKFDSSHDKHYTLMGIQTYDNKVQTLFWNEFEIPKEAFIKPLPKLEVDTKVLVWRDYNNNNNKYKRHFSHFDEKGNIYAFINGRTSFSINTECNDKSLHTNKWDNYEIYQEGDK